jgi:hypothetical protein
VPAGALSRAGARVVESDADGRLALAEDAWARLDALPDPRSPQGWIYPLACLVAVAVCAMTTAPGSTCCEAFRIRITYDQSTRHVHYSAQIEAATITRQRDVIPASCVRIRAVPPAGLEPALERF